jgi:hypothetical protein
MKLEAMNQVKIEKPFPMAAIYNFYLFLWRQLFDQHGWVLYTEIKKDTVKICIQQSPFGQRKTDCIGQVTTYLWSVDLNYQFLSIMIHTLLVTFFLSCHRKFHMNWTSFKRSPV